MDFEQCLSKYSVQEICEQCTEFPPYRAILSCLLQQMIQNQETKGVIVSDIVITKSGVLIDDLYLFQANPSDIVKPLQLNPGLWAYTIDVECLSQKLKGNELCLEK
jgi:hypothetical protein